MKNTTMLRIVLIDLYWEASKQAKNQTVKDRVDSINKAYRKLAPRLAPDAPRKSKQAK